ncbi:MAG: glycosyl transferase [Acidobacteria bacterium]|nr:glycosyl transferase [Acidobacteriota bacterium]
MADFYQTGVVTTLHRLRQESPDRLEEELQSYSERFPIGLVLPALYSEFETPAMHGIVDKLRHVNYLRRIVVAIGRCTQSQYEDARHFFDGFRTPVSTIWMEDPRVTAIFSALERNDLKAGEPGKGRTCWFAIGTLLATEDCEGIALHDCDILSYDRDLLPRLIYPLAHPNLGYEFSKGYYSRVSDRLHGRVTRLFFTPLVRAIQDMTPEIPYLRFLDSFRYALAGEFALTTDLARTIRIPGDWGLEVGVLAEVYRNTSLHRICQVDIADNYDHKHQPLIEGDASNGLRRMTCDIAKSVYRTIAQEGFVLTRDHFRTLQVYYVRFAQDNIRRFYADASLNGLQFDLHTEDSAVLTFAHSLRAAAEEYLRDPLGAPQIPNWNRIFAAMPGISGLLTKSVDH